MSNGFHIISTNAGKQLRGRGLYYSPIIKNINHPRIGLRHTALTEDSKELVSSIITHFGKKAVVSKEEIFDKIAKPEGLTVSELEGILNYSTNCKFPLLEKTRILKSKLARKKKTEPVKRKRGRPRTGKPLPKFGIEGLVE